MGSLLCKVSKLSNTNKEIYKKILEIQNLWHLEWENRQPLWPPHQHGHAKPFAKMLTTI